MGPYIMQSPGVPQLVVTLGPASWHLAPDLLRSGATTLRLNASHLDADNLHAVLAGLQRDAPGAAVVVDLQGAKMRLGAFAPFDVAAGDALTFAETNGGTPVPHPELMAQARPGDTISVDDGRVRFRVTSSRGGTLEAVALDAGRLQPRKGINVEEHPIALGGLTTADRQAIRTAAALGVRAFAFSFMTDGREAAWVRAAAPGAEVIGKVERREASAALGALAGAVDAVWICRGDLGAQLGDAALARFVASVGGGSLPVPVLMAGQVLEHLTRHRVPTRSEVCHLHDLLARGFAGIVLSDETAIGDDPVHATVIASRLLADLLS